jgi:hypothetical protein
MHEILGLILSTEKKEGKKGDVGRSWGRGVSALIKNKQKKRPT